MAGVDRTYLNPVFPHSFPDPFVLKHSGYYYAYSTGRSADGRIFEILRSEDLITWSRVGGAMDPLPTDEPFYWAPEVTYHNGKFYLYYSVGNEEFMALRVAVSDTPDGGFADAGVKLTSQQFAIDAHVFRDEDRSWWMFYATDFLDHSHIGTGTVVDRMVDMFTLAGDPRPVTRAKYDWQVYDPARKEKGGVRWHTVEGPFVLKRKGTYYEMFSGGNWQNVSYGVSFAVTDDLSTDQEWEQHSDGTTTFPLIRTIPEKVVGPGHNSVVKGPNGRELYCIYHLWQNQERVLGVDRMDFAGGSRMFVSGPSFTPQECPYPASTTQRAPLSESKISTFGSFLCELSLVPGDYASIGLLDGERDIGSLEISATDFVWRPSTGTQIRAPLSDDLDRDVIHELSIEIDGGIGRCRLDNVEAAIDAPMPSKVTSVRCDTANLTWLAVTHGFEDLFERNDADDRGWRTEGDVLWNARDRMLEISDGSTVSRDIGNGDFELAANFRLLDRGQISIDCGVACRVGKDSVIVGNEAVPIPADVNMELFHQVRLVRRGSNFSVWLDGIELTEITEDGANRLAISAAAGTILLDMVRWTSI